MTGTKLHTEDNSKSYILLEGHENRIKAIEDENKSLNKDVVKSLAQIDNIEDKITSIQSDIKDIETLVEKHMTELGNAIEKHSEKNESLANDMRIIVDRDKQKTDQMKMLKAMGLAVGGGGVAKFVDWLSTYFPHLFE